MISFRVSAAVAFIHDGRHQTHTSPHPRLVSFRLLFKIRAVQTLSPPPRPFSCATHRPPFPSVLHHTRRLLLFRACRGLEDALPLLRGQEPKPLLERDALLAELVVGREARCVFWGLSSGEGESSDAWIRAVIVARRTQPTTGSRANPGSTDLMRDHPFDAYTPLAANKHTTHTTPAQPIPCIIHHPSAPHVPGCAE